MTPAIIVGKDSTVADPIRFFKLNMLSSILLYNISNELTGNALACHVFSFFSKERRWPDLEWLLSLDMEKNPGMPDMTPKITPKSFRCKCFVLSGVRKFDCNYYYGLDMRDEKGMPASMIILGRNGTGKTSIFTAMEKISLGKSNIASLRGFSYPSSQITFLTHATEDPLKSYIGFDADDGWYTECSIKSSGNGLIHEASFCSDYDVAEVERTYDISDFLYTQLGLSDIRILSFLLSRFQRRIRSHIHNTRISKEGIALFSNLTRHFQSVINSNLSSQFKILSPLIKKMTGEILADYFDSEIGERFVVDISDEGIPNFKIELSSSESTVQATSVSPRFYLNTFRFKLFVFSLKLAAGLCMKIHNKLDCPYVIDDMFDSSDFDNRKDIGNFFETMLKSHDRIINELIDEEKSKGNPDSNEIEFLQKILNPQIIFFTQDDLIAECLYSGISDVQSVKMVRLFNPEDCADRDKVDIRVKMNSYGTPYEKKICFKNLFDEIVSKC